MSERETRTGSRRDAGTPAWVGEPELRRAMMAAAREFNAGRYFEAHEALEEALDEVPDDLFPLVVGLIQVAVGYHKLTQGLLPGAERMLGLGLDKLAPYAADAGGVDVAALRARAGEDLAALRGGALDATRLADRPPRLVPRPSARRRRRGEVG
jgi:hypothetical protein